MSELRDILKSSVAERMFGTAEECWNLTTGARFMAEYEPGVPIEQREMLMIDPRQTGKLHVYDPVAAAGLLQGGKVKVLLYGQWVSHSILRRENNAGTVQTIFGLMQDSPKDQG